MTKATPAKPVEAAMDWDTFAKQKTTRQRQSSYAPFILGLAPRKVYDASATFPNTKTETLRGAIYLQARRLGRHVSILSDPKTDHLLVAYIGDQQTLGEHTTRKTTKRKAKGGK